MPAYNFMERFATLVESGQKKQTIRKNDRDAKVGDTAYLYTGQRTKRCRRIGESIIAGVYPIDSTPEIGPYIVIKYNENNSVHIIDVEKFAEADGFNSADEMLSFFDQKYGIPFYGYLHVWE